MSATLLGLVDWGGEGSDDGHLDLTATWRVITSSLDDGPVVVASASGLPAIGSTWAIGNDSFITAHCLAGWKVSRFSAEQGTSTYHWTVEQKFSTRPVNPTQKGGNPLLYEPSVSGSSQQQRKETDRDRHGDLLAATNFQPLKGAARERNFHSPQVNIAMNVVDLDLALYSNAMNKVNDATLWGLSARHILMTAFGWSEELYGDHKYYKITMGFEADFDGIDKRVFNGGTMCLKEYVNGFNHNKLTRLPPLGEIVAGTPNYLNRDCLAAFRDADNNTGVYTLLSIHNEPVLPSAAVSKLVEHYDEFNFLLLGIPATL